MAEVLLRAQPDLLLDCCLSWEEGWNLSLPSPRIECDLSTPPSPTSIEVRAGSILAGLLSSAKKCCCQFVEVRQTALTLSAFPLNEKLPKEFWLIGEEGHPTSFLIEIAHVHAKSRRLSLKTSYSLSRDQNQKERHSGYFTTL